MPETKITSSKFSKTLIAFKSWMKDTGKQLAIAIVLVLIIRSSIIEPYKIPSGSMIPSLFIGDHIFVNKLSYGLKIPFSEFFLDKPIYITQQEIPSRGDVIVFRYPKNISINYIKRVIGLPGDTIEIRGKTLFINKKPIKEKPYNDKKMMEGIENSYDKSKLSLFISEINSIKHPILYDPEEPSNLDWGPYEVPSGSLFVMGDNRDRSSDSRFWGFVPLANIKGKALFIWLNLSIFWKDKFKISFRPSRTGKLIL